MYRILLADDEGIMLQSIHYIISQTFGESCEVQMAKTGTAAFEMTEEFHPDIIFMDIRMPGMSGIEVMREIRKTNSHVIIIMITAYDKFDYAKEALNLGAFEFITKPVMKDTVIEVLTKAMRKTDADRQSKMDNLKIREKLETVVPMIESGFISSIIMQENEEELAYYQELLDIHEEFAFVELIRFGEKIEDGVLTNQIGISMRAQKFYNDMREIIKGYFPCIVGPVMGNRVVAVMLMEEYGSDYEERIRIIERTRGMVQSLEKQIDAKFRVGIGRNYPMNNLKDSYWEALHALSQTKNHITHYEDVLTSQELGSEYPDDLEKSLMQAMEHGEEVIACELADKLFEWMEVNYASDINCIRQKTLEIVMIEERTSLEHKDYQAIPKSEYLPMIMQMQDAYSIRSWLKTKIHIFCGLIEKEELTRNVSVVEQAKQYLKEHYESDVSLDEVARQVNISPYYFSKLFKDEGGVNFIDYLTGIRIQKAKELLARQEYSMKEICVRCGYSDPNYFSRIFKKMENETPSEYRERVKQ